MLLLLARPIATSLPQRSSGEGVVETRLAARDALPDAPDDAPPHASRRAAALLPTGVQPAALPASEPAAFPEDPPPLPAGPRVLASILRASGLACLGGREASLSPAERELCRERLGAQAWRASSLSAIEPEERAGYDAQVRTARRAMAPLTARGAGGGFGPDDRLRAGRRPRVGCALRFGPNADRALDSSTDALRAGPCFLRTPASAPTPY